MVCRTPDQVGWVRALARAIGVFLDKTLHSHNTSPYPGILIYSQLLLYQTPSGHCFVSGIARVHNTGSYFKSNLYRWKSEFCP